MDLGLGIAPTVGEIQDYEKEEYAMNFDLRAKETLGALAQIGQYLSGIPGRKNLIWVSESFPISIAPDPDTGNNAFAGIRNYTDQVKTVANALTDAQVAVYPMDVRGLQANQSLSASQNINLPESRMTGPAMAGRLNHEDTELLQAQGTMDELAQDTGGKACKNSNDLAGCVMTALKDSSSYYELSFYPQNVNWDGRFHKIVVKTSRPGVKLTYRRGYYALDAAFAREETAAGGSSAPGVRRSIALDGHPIDRATFASRPIRKSARRPAIYALDFGGGAGFRSRGRYVQPECPDGGLRVCSKEYDFQIQ